MTCPVCGLLNADGRRSGIFLEAIPRTDPNCFANYCFALQGSLVAIWATAAGGPGVRLVVRKPAAANIGRPTRRGGARGNLPRVQ